VQAPHLPPGPWTPPQGKPQRSVDQSPHRARRPGLLPLTLHTLLTVPETRPRACFESNRTSRHPVAQENHSSSASPEGDTLGSTCVDAPSSPGRSRAPNRPSPTAPPAEAGLTVNSAWLSIPLRSFQPSDSARKHRRTFSRRLFPAATPKDDLGSETRSRPSSRTSPPEGVDAESRLPLCRSRGPSPPKGLREHSLNRRVASIAFEAKLPTPTQRSAGDTVQYPVLQLTFRKTHEHSTPQLSTRRPPPEDGDHPAPDSPKAAAHVRTRSARHDRTPESVHEPEGSACATAPQSRVPRHTGARNATPIAPTADEQPRDEDPCPKPKPLTGTS
jgi:hypothetical protein